MRLCIGEIPQSVAANLGGAGLCIEFGICMRGVTVVGSARHKSPSFAAAIVVVADASALHSGVDLASLARMISSRSLRDSRRPAIDFAGLGDCSSRTGLVSTGMPSLVAIRLLNLAN